MPSSCTITANLFSRIDRINNLYNIERMKKLTIAHLAPYLPYGIKGYFLSIFDIVTGFDNDFKIISSLDVGNCLITDFKPLLRPLSDLTKEIEHNGEKFVPFGFIFELCEEYASRHPNRKILDNAANGWAICNRLKPESLSYTSFKMLLEWHFDVFGLIENGLAIDINTI